MTFSSAENAGSKWWNWNTNPSVSRRARVRSSSFACSIGRPFNR